LPLRRKRPPDPGIDSEGGSPVEIARTVPGRLKEREMENFPFSNGERKLVPPEKAGMFPPGSAYACKNGQSLNGRRWPDMSWWVYIVVLGIMFSGFMTVWISRKEREEELRQIEKEGEVYIRRMEKEKEKKNRKAMSRGV